MKKKSMFECYKSLLSLYEQANLIGVDTAAGPDDNLTYAEYCGHFKKQEETMGDHSLKFFFDDLIPKDRLSAHFFTERYTPQRILKSGPVTIVFWRDGTKTMVRRAPDEEDNTYAAFTAALAIEIFGSNSALNRMLKAKTEYQKDKKKSAAPDQGCTDTCPIDFDAIERNLAADMETKTAHDAGKKLADTPTGTLSATR